ncbi:MAG: type IX secretion system protein PorQ [bacterium]
MNIKKYLIIFIIFVSNSAFAQNIYEFLRLDASPRAAAMAGSFVANYDDPNVMFYNPAGIATLENNPVSFSFLKHVLDINSASIAGSMEIKDWGRFSAGITYINYGSFDKADQFGNRTGEFGAGDIAFLVGYAGKLADNFYYGSNIKFIYSSIDTKSSSGLALDLGLQYLIPNKKWAFGFAVLNCGTQLSSYYDKKEDLPLDVRFGVSKELDHTPFTFSISFNKLNDKYDTFSKRFQQFVVGSEIKLSKPIKIRVGYDNARRKDLKIGSSTGIAGISIGLGLTIGDYKFDYAFSSLGEVGGMHRIGISTTFL